MAAVVDKAPAWFYKSVFGMKSYITVEMAKKYLDSSSDNLVSFDRRVIRGKVLNDPRYLNQKPIVSKESSFTTERLSTTTGSSEMTTIGGARSRQESKLLELRKDIANDKEKQALKLSDESKESLISDDDQQ